VEEYLAAYRGLEAAPIDALRVEAALSLAALYYQEVKDYGAAAEWAVLAREAARADGDEYAAARADALLAASWIETPARKMTREVTAPEPHQRLVAARELLGRLEAFHARRGEPYDAALQYNNIGYALYADAAYD
ncbi:hypothetical protein G3N28_23350, partial [Desulfobacter hydrogenophilus]|uniref:hypothetical protein n=1 Tax=Desulfobacter hydrogenophilus TaxID=2291 RepID=UPI0013D85D02